MDLYTVRLKGDTEEQAFLRDSMIKRKKTSGGTYVSKILLALKPGAYVLDIGCGTAHVIKELGANQKYSAFLGLDVSEAMLKVAKKNCGDFGNISLVQADGLDLPFSDNRFDIVITRLAEYSPQEAWRVLKTGGFFFECGLGPEADKEIPAISDTRDNTAAQGEGELPQLTRHTAAMPSPLAIVPATSQVIPDPSGPRGQGTVVARSEQG